MRFVLFMLGCANPSPGPPAITRSAQTDPGANQTSSGSNPDDGASAGDATVPASSDDGASSLASSGGDAVSGASLVGLWSSSACGSRKWRRELELSSPSTAQGAGTFVLRDLVAPCPPNARCVWTGVMVRQGNWTVKDGKVRLVEVTAASPAGSHGPGPVTLPIVGAVPSDLAVSGDRLVGSETAADGSTRTCTWRRVTHTEPGGVPSSGEAPRVRGPR